MKAKLIKTEGSYILKDGLLQVIGIDDENLKERLNCNYLLSTKNCQAIERGYDLDELAKENAKHYPNNISQEYINSVVSFKDGFQKALEILGDKKFSEENLLKAFTIGLFSEFEKANYTKEYDEFLKSLQQTEWEVTFNPDEKDSDGCLILKLKSE